jgi:hypothetical protein
MSRNLLGAMPACLLGKPIVGRISVTCLRGIAVVPRCLVRDVSTGQNGYI